MLISSTSVEMLKIPVTDGYQAAGRAVDANWHVLVRVRTADGIEGVGYIVQPRGDLMQTIASGAAELAERAGQNEYVNLERAIVALDEVLISKRKFSALGEAERLHRARATRRPERPARTARRHAPAHLRS